MAITADDDERDHEARDVVVARPVDRRDELVAGDDETDDDDDGLHHHAGASEFKTPELAATATF